MILAPLRGVTVRCFREVFTDELAYAGFTEAVTPFIAAMPGVDPLKDRELRDCSPSLAHTLKVTPQFIGKSPEALEQSLVRIRTAGYTTADLNAGCPFPMVRNKGRGSGLLRTPEVLWRMLETGCRVMGSGNFSLKVRLGIDHADELLSLMPIINEFPLRFLTIHARTARQMYTGKCDRAAFDRVAARASMPVVYNGDVPFPLAGDYDRHKVMIGRGFIRYLGTRSDAANLVHRYVNASRSELCGDHAVLGRIKELLSYWKELPQWSRKWPVIKLCRTLGELESLLKE